MEHVSLQQMDAKTKRLLLRELGYDIKGSLIIDGRGFIVKDRYTEVEVRADNMVILPGSTIILDNNPLSIAAYMQEYGDAL